MSMTTKKTIFIDSAAGGNITLGSESRLDGTWYVTNPKGTWSDVNKKTDICSMTDNYELFFDNLKPVTYKYIDGTSGRMHTGFIAQEVNAALACANIKSNDFAGLVISERGSANEVWALRYEEFISLNT